MAENTQPKQFGSTQDLVKRASYRIGMIRLPDLNLDNDNIDYFAMDITPDVVVSFEIRDSISKLYRTGTLTLSDRGSWRDILPLTGNEVFTIAYRNHLHDGNSELAYKVIHFRIFHIEENEILQNDIGTTGQAQITLHLVEFPIFDMLTYNHVYRTTPNNEGLQINEFVETMLKGIPNLEKHYELDIEKGPEDYLFPNMWLPRWSPLKMLNFLNNFMISQNGNPFYTFKVISSPRGETFKPKIKYTSIYTLFDTPHFRTYSSTKSDVEYNQPRPHSLDTGKRHTVPDPSQDTSFAPADTIIHRKIHWGDANKLIHNSMTGRTYMSYLYEEGNEHVSLDKAGFMKRYKTLGQYLPIPQDVSFGNQWSLYEGLPYNSPRMVQAYLDNRFAKNAFKQMFLVCQTYVNETRLLGEKANLYLNTPSKDRGMDMLMGGRWMTWSVNDIVMSDGTAFSEVTFARDSFWIADSSYLDRSLNQYEDDINRGSAGI